MHDPKGAILKHRPLLLALAALLGVAFLATACGGDDAAAPPRRPTSR